MYGFVYKNQVIATADNTAWLLYLLDEYPGGEIVNLQDQPVVEGAQTL
jgi:hypothetical protein